MCSDIATVLSISELNQFLCQENIHAYYHFSIKYICISEKHILIGNTDFTLSFWKQFCTELQYNYKTHCSYLKLEMFTQRTVVIYKSTSLRTGWTMLKVKSFYNQAVRTLGGLGLSNRPLDVSKTGRSLLQLRPLVALDVLEAPPENIWRTRNNFI